MSSALEEASPVSSSLRPLVEDLVGAQASRLAQCVRSRMEAVPWAGAACLMMQVHCEPLPAEAPQAARAFSSSQPHRWGEALQEARAFSSSRTQRSD